MKISEAYVPHAVFTPGGSNEALPRALIAPARYVQGSNALDGLPRYLRLLEVNRAALLISAGGRERFGSRLESGLQSAEIEACLAVFGGESSLEEIARVAEILKAENVDCLVAIGGGKCVDTGKAVAHRLSVPVVIAPTLASNDAPCSALSVIYTPEGATSGVEFYPESPAVVLVDSRIVADAPSRYLVSGIGDAMATYYEASVCQRNPAALNVFGARPTLAAMAIGEICRSTLMRRGEAAAEAAADSRVDDSLEDVVEANTLLSGLGFESGGVAAAHGFAQSFTFLPQTDANYLHGEMVALGTLAQLMIEKDEAEARKVASFFARIGLPVHLQQLSVDRHDQGAIGTVVEGALQFPFIGNMPMEITHEVLASGLQRADELGRAITDEVGDDAYRSLHA